MPQVTMSEEDLVRASCDGVWYPLCPCCETHTAAEPDATVIFCVNCDQRIEIDNPFD